MRSAGLEQVADQVESLLAQRAPQAARMFRKCLLNTLETTVTQQDDGTTFVVTGDIPAMWLRDSAAQIEPYVRFAASDESLRAMVRGVIMRHARYIGIDPYANAFNVAANGRGHQDDRTEMNPWVWERKWELDSLCYPIRLCKLYWDATADPSVFDESVHNMFKSVVATMRTEQNHDASPYKFVRPFTLTSGDTLAFHGVGTPTDRTGMVWSGFRPSDDACIYGYLVPANMFAVVVLGYIEEFALSRYGDSELASQASELRGEIDAAIEAYAIVKHPTYGYIYAYEVDGRGRLNLMDDANIPSLLSIPYLGYRPATDPIYRNTRAFVLSEANPHYHTGRHAAGVGSPHTPNKNIWPLALIMQGLTATDPAESWDLINTLAATTAGTGYMHESFDPNDPGRYTRRWFGWANSLFAELVMRALAIR